MSIKRRFTQHTARHKVFEKISRPTQPCAGKNPSLKTLGTYRALQEKGLVTLEGKDYEVKDGDIIYFRFSV